MPFRGQSHRSAEPSPGFREYEGAGADLDVSSYPLGFLLALRCSCVYAEAHADAVRARGLVFLVTLASGAPWQGTAGFSGATMSDPGAGNRLPGTRSVPLELFRVPAGRTVRIRTLTSGMILGFRVHWRKGGSDYCDPETCFQKCGGFRAEWKGYLPVHRWQPGLNAWVPCVLEVTENADHDMGGCVSRGQVWEFVRDAKRRGQGSKLSAGFVEQLDGQLLPPAFDMLPVLAHIWRGVQLKINLANPVPPRPRGQVEEGSPPMIDIPDAAAPPTSAPKLTREEYLASVARAAQKKIAERNGHPHPF